MANHRPSPLPTGRSTRPADPTMKFKYLTNFAIISSSRDAGVVYLKACSQGRLINSGWLQKEIDYATSIRVRRSSTICGINTAQKSQVGNVPKAGPRINSLIVSSNQCPAPARSRVISPANTFLRHVEGRKQKSWHSRSLLKRNETDIEAHRRRQLV